MSAMLTAAAKSAAAFLKAVAFSLFILFFSCIGKKNNQGVAYLVWVVC